MGRWIEKAERDLIVAEHLTVVEQCNATKYATVLRYPGDYEPITLEEARAAVEMARRGRASLRTLLPQAILVEPEDECR